MLQAVAEKNRSAVESILQYLDTLDSKQKYLETLDSQQKQKLSLTTRAAQVEMNILFFCTFFWGGENLNYRIGCMVHRKGINPRFFCWDNFNNPPPSKNIE